MSLFPKISPKNIGIMGRMWTIRSVPNEEFKYSEDTECGAFADTSSFEIIVRELTDDECKDIGNVQSYIKFILRHEIVHAFLFESGLWGCSSSSNAWALNEEMVEWISIQHEKLHDAFRFAGALDQYEERIGQ